MLSAQQLQLVTGIQKDMISHQMLDILLRAKKNITQRTSEDSVNINTVYNLCIVENPEMKP